MGVIPTLAATGYLHQFLLVVDRTGINPIPTADVCNTLDINGLSSLLQHSASVEAWFIPALAAAWYLHQFLLVAGRTGINPAPTVDVCNTLVINGLPSQHLRKAGRIRPLVGLEEAKEYNYSVDPTNLCGVSLF